MTIEDNPDHAAAWDHTVGNAETVRRVFEEAAVAVVALEGPEHRCVAANAPFRALMPQFKIGMPFHEIIPETLDRGLSEQFDWVYTTGEPYVVTEWRLECAPDHYGHVERFADLFVTPVHDDDGGIAGIQVTINDITANARAQREAAARLENMTDKYARARDAALVMQQALLSSVVPMLPGADVAGAYLVAAQDTAAGGDWFDAAVDPDGRLVLVVGDVLGHGVNAAAVMAQLRTAVRMQLKTASNLSDVMDSVDRFAADIPGATSTTMCLGRLDTITGQFEYCTAGHPPPLLLSADVGPRYLKPSTAGPLGSGLGFATCTEHIAEGDVVVLYTDGIIERPGRPVPASTVEVAHLMARIERGCGFAQPGVQRAVDRICSQTIELAVRPTGYSDDITLLVAQRRTPPPPLHVVVKADEHAERTVRAQLRDWLDVLGADSTNGRLLEHAISEFVANAVEHAYAGTTPGDISVEAALGQDGQLRTRVSDRGRWNPPRMSKPHRGRGLSLAQLLIPDTVIRHDDAGTTVTSTFRLTRAAHIVTDPDKGPRIPAERVPTTFDVGVGDDGWVIVVGDVDTTSAPTLAGVLAKQSRAGTDALSVDLSAVTHLGSAGVNVLFNAVQRAADHHSDVTLVAPPRGTAHHVLSLVGLPMTTETVDALE